MDSSAIQRIQNLWATFARKLPFVGQATEMVAVPEIDFSQVGGLAAAKDELLTYACAATDPEVYARWGTFPPSALLLIGPGGVGKALLAGALARQTETGFLRVRVPRFVLEVVHSGGKAGELINGWREVLEEMPPVTVFFDELEFSQADEFGEYRTDLPIGQIMDFMLELVDRTIAVGSTLVVGSTAHPDTLRPAFVTPGRFERIVEVAPILPDDIVAALRIHADAAEKRASHPLFEEVDWVQVVNRFREPSIGAWVRMMHAALRRKARCEAAGEEVTLIRTQDLLEEVERARDATGRLRPVGGTYI